MVRKERLELSRVAPLAPKASASTNSATFANAQRGRLPEHSTNTCKNNNLYLIRAYVMGLITGLGGNIGTAPDSLRSGMQAPGSAVHRFSGLTTGMTGGAF